MRLYTFVQYFTHHTVYTEDTILKLSAFKVGSAKFTTHPRSIIVTYEIDTLFSRETVSISFVATL